MHEGNRAPARFRRQQVALGERLGDAEPEKEAGDTARSQPLVTSDWRHPHESPWPHQAPSPTPAHLSPSLSLPHSLSPPPPPSLTPSPPSLCHTYKLTVTYELP